MPRSDVSRFGISAIAKEANCCVLQIPPASPLLHVQWPHLTAPTNCLAGAPSRIQVWLWVASTVGPAIQPCTLTPPVSRTIHQVEFLSLPVKGTLSALQRNSGSSGLDLPSSLSLSLWSMLAHAISRSQEGKKCFFFFNSAKGCLGSSEGKGELKSKPTILADV